MRAPSPLRVAGLGLLLGPLVACSAPEPPRAVPPRPAPTLAASDPGAAVDETTVVAQAQDGSAAAVDPEIDQEEGGPAPEPLPGPLVLGSVAGAPITATDLLLGWYEVSGRDVWLVVEKLVAIRLSFAEAERLSIRLAPDAVEERVASERAELEEEARKKGYSVEDYVTGQLGVAPDVYFERLRLATIRQMLAERAVRCWTLGSENRAIRLIVVAEPELMAAIQAELAAGADFAELARRHSVDETAKRDGLLPYVVRQEHSPLARLAFSTPSGDLGGPLETSGHHFLIRVEQVRAPLEGDWRTIGPAVEESLAEHPVGDSEFLYWKLAMEDRYPIDMRRLKSLLGMQR